MRRKRVIFNTIAEMKKSPDDIRPLPCVLAMRSISADPTQQQESSGAEVVLPDGKPASLIGLFACTNHVYGELSTYGYEGCYLDRP